MTTGRSSRFMVLLGVLVATLVWVFLVVAAMFFVALSSEGVEQQARERVGGIMLIVGFLGLFPVTIGTWIGLERLLARRGGTPYKALPKQESSTSPKWTRRAAAFLIEYLLFALIWGAVNNSVTWPIPEALASLGAVATFCLFFALAEGRGSIRASPGKRFMGLAVIGRDGRLPALPAIILRALILASILVFDWGSVNFPQLFERSLPLIVTWLVTIPLAVVLYNASLAVRGGERLMLQDGLTNTRVVSLEFARKLGTERAIGESQPKRHWPKPALFMLAMLLALAAGFFLRGTVVGSTQISRRVEGAIAQELGLRSRVEINSTETRYFDNDAKTVRTLEIHIWLPLMAWNQENITTTANVAASQLTVDPGYYHSGTLMHSSGPGILRIYQSLELILPSEPKAVVEQ